MCFAIGRSTRLYIGVSRFDRDGSSWVGGGHPFEGVLYEKKTAFEVGGFGTKVLRPSGIFVNGRVQGLPFVVRTYLFLLDVFWGSWFRVFSSTRFSTDAYTVIKWQHVFKSEGSK